MKIDRSEVPEGATHWSPGDGDRYEAYWKPTRGGYDCYCPEWDKPAWQNISDELPDYAIPIAPKWTGEGLPPVGTVCEFVGPCDVIMDSGAWKKELKIGSRVEIIYHYETGVALVAVFKFEVDFGHMVEQATAGCFRPMRTPEQITEEERTKTIDDMVKALGMDEPGTAEYIRCGLIYDAGYRKQVAP